MSPFMKKSLGDLGAGQAGGGGGRWISHNSSSKEIIWMCNLIFKLNFKKNQ